MTFKSAKVYIILITVSAISLVRASNHVNTRQKELVLGVEHLLSDGSNKQDQIVPQSTYSRGPLILPANNDEQVAKSIQVSHTISADNAPSNSVIDRTNLKTNQWFNSAELETNRIKQAPSAFSAANLELAFRQASIDESFFHAPPALSHNEQWLSAPDTGTHSSLNSSTQRADMATPSSSTDSSAWLGQTSSQASTTSANQAELSNQVIYEGPATVPPANNYYFSASSGSGGSWNSDHGDSNKAGRSSNNWWIIGLGHEYERASNLTADDYKDYCANSDLLSSKQRTLCSLHPKIMLIVARGIKLAIDECQSRFTTSRWNCTLVLHESLQGNLDSSFSIKTQNLGDVIKRPNRERSFLNAIIAAGLAHAMTKACSNDELPEECSCDKKIKSKANRGRIEWISCSDDIDYGARFSREFTDSMEYEYSDTTAMINLHNYEVGRRVFKSSTDITCTCQDGENNHCQTKRCWKHLGSFKDIGDDLLRRYESATHVQTSSKDPHKLRPVKRGVRKPRRKDLVFIEESPDYCSPNPRLGILGTQNRSCNSTSSSSDSCSVLCCGRGYQIVVEEVEEDCNCKFVWCCQVKCERCKRHVTHDLCN